MEHFLEHTLRWESRHKNKDRFAEFTCSFWYTHDDVPCFASQPHFTSNHPCRSHISSVCSAMTSFFYSSAPDGCRSRSGPGMKLYFSPSGYCQSKKSIFKRANPRHSLYLVSDPVPFLHKNWESCKHEFPDFWVLQLWKSYFQNCFMSWYMLKWSGNI